jgi:hypothetical protein
MITTSIGIPTRSGVEFTCIFIMSVTVKTPFFSLILYLYISMRTQNTPIFLRYGGAEKDSSEMSMEELGKASSSILRRAKEKAFFKGRPIIFSEGGKVYEEWPDGRIVERN